MAAQSGPQRQQYPSHSYMPNGAPAGGQQAVPSVVPTPGARPLDPNQGRVIQQGSARVLCVADVRGDLNSLNVLAKTANADYVIHTGDFGFYDEQSLGRIADKTLKHIVQYSPLLSDDTRRQINQLPSNASIKNTIGPQQLPLSQLPQFLTGQLKFDVPVYAVWGACEDVQVLEKLRAGEYKIPNLNILDEANSRLLETGGVKLRLLGLGGALVMHKLFDNGEGKTTIAGGQGTMWTTLLQMGELVDTANRTFDPTETRLFVTHASPSREGLLNQLAVSMKADFSVSGGLHFRYGSSYNEFSVNPNLDYFRGKLASSKASFQDVWDTVKSEVEPIVAENEAHQKLLSNALDVISKMPAVANSGAPFGSSAGGQTGQVDEVAFKNMWNFNLADAAYGWLALDIEGGRIGTEMRALGFNFSHRGLKNSQQMAEAIKANNPIGSPSIPNSAPIAFAPSPAQTQPSAPPSAPIATNNQTRPGQQPRGPSGHQSQQNRPQQNTQAPTQQQTPQPPIASTSANRAQSQGQPSKVTPTPTTNGTAAATDAKPNGVSSPAPAEAASTATPPPQNQPREPSQGIFLTNGPTERDEVKNMFTEDQRNKIQSVESIGRSGNQWHIKFASHEDMRSVLDAQPKEMKMHSNTSGPSMKMFHQRTNFSRPQGAGGYKSGSDTEGGRGNRGGFGRGGGRGGRGNRGGDRGERGDRGDGGMGRGSTRGRGGLNKDGAAGGQANPSAAPAGGASS